MRVSITIGGVMLFGIVGYFAWRGYTRNQFAKKCAADGGILASKTQCDLPEEIAM